MLLAQSSFNIGVVIDIGRFQRPDKRVDPSGFEPLTYRMPCERSGQLSYGPLVMIVDDIFE